MYLIDSAVCDDSFSIQVPGEDLGILDGHEQFRRVFSECLRRHAGARLFLPCQSPCMTVRTVGGAQTLACDSCDSHLTSEDVTGFRAQNYEDSTRFKGELNYGTLGKEL